MMQDLKEKLLLEIVTLRERIDKMEAQLLSESEAAPICKPAGKVLAFVPREVRAAS